MTAVEWIKNTVELCINIYKTDVDNNRESFNILEDIYNDFDEEDKAEIERIFLRNFGNDDLIYIFSVFIFYMDNEAFKQLLYSEIVKKNSTDIIERTVFELQIRKFLGDYFAEKALYHRRSVELVCNIFEKKEYIPVCTRNKKRVVIFADQILNPRHAPTKIIMEFCYVLQEYLHYEVVIFSCPTDTIFDREKYYYTICLKSIPDKEDVWLEALYRDIKITLRQTCLKEDRVIEKYSAIFDFIYDYNPYFVLNMGANNPMVDYIKTFTTLVASDFSVECPIAEADILMRGTRRDIETENMYAEVMEGKQQIFTTRTLPVIGSEDTKVLKREENGLPEDKFLICLVGNRLDNEIDKNFIKILESVLRENFNTCLVIIGDVEVLNKKLDSSIFEGRVYYMGYREDLESVYTMMDLYLNPDRQGGGWSAGMAIMSEVPVVTLPDCDVASNVDSRFWVDSYEQMILRINRYVNDKTFYEEEKSYIHNNCIKDLEKETLEYVTEFMNLIIDSIEKMDR